MPVNHVQRETHPHDEKKRFSARERAGWHATPRMRKCHEGIRADEQGENEGCEEENEIGTQIRSSIPGSHVLKLFLPANARTEVKAQWGVLTFR